MIPGPIRDMKYRLPVAVNHGNLSYPYWRSKESIERALSGCALTFVASVGREGSGFVGEIFSANDGLISFHEPRPFCNGRRLIASCINGHASQSLILRVKVSTIAASIVNSGCRHYLESSHMFLKTFGRYLIKEIDVPFNLISLRRPILKTIASFRELAWFGSRYNRAQNWVYKVADGTPLTSRQLRIDNETDQILSYIISEKINELNFVSRASPSRVNYVRLNVPPSKENLLSVSESIGLSGSVRQDLRKANTRQSAKISQVETETLLKETRDYFKKNEEMLRQRSVIFCSEDMQMTIGDEHWGVC